MRISRKLADCVSIVNFYKYTENTPISFYDFDKKISNCFYKEENSFVLKTDEKLSNDNLKQLNINGRIIQINNNIKIEILDSRVKTTSFVETEFVIDKFSSVGFRKDTSKYFKLIIHNHKRKQLRFDHIFEKLIYVSSENQNTNLQGISFKLDKKEYYLYFSNIFLIIEGLIEDQFVEFDANCRIILACFGLITGYSPMKYGFYFTYDNNKFLNVMDYIFVSNFIETYDSQFKVIDTNTFKYVDKEKNHEEIQIQADKLRKNLNPISCDTFSKLCNMVKFDNKMADAVYLTLEANRSSLISMGVIYCVVLETLTNVICSQNIDNILPIQDKHKAKELCNKLNLTAQEYLLGNKIFHIEKDYLNSAIKKKIDNINSPTNQDKLIKPFDILDIKIDEDDKKIINQRNDFLHGNSFNIGEDIERCSKEIFYTVLKLNFLVNALILKFVGHTGKIVNLAKVYLPEFKKNDKEEYYRVI
ncbi:MAG: hypothetical protein HQK79_21915 [Desulfobacterales bacterium]|nr:hypothetical protein [Desulfobacterales bacterium]